MGQFTIGIDTGGTYTDAVLIDTRSHEIVASAKSLTTRGDLSQGVSRALGSVLEAVGNDFDRSSVELVCLSTTLATNALVEGHGSSVTTFLVGFDEGMAARTGIDTGDPRTSVVSVAGGHRHDGQELEQLDEAAVLHALEQAPGQAEAFAVAGLYSIRNHEHERRVEALIREKTGKPVTASCDLSDSLHGPRRALTATCNARIISLLVRLEASVYRAMESVGIKAQLMIVKGDGSIAPAGAVTSKPIETILSGPAASVIGARFLTGESDFIISDIGGTTSDVAKVRRGWPELNEEGSDVGGYHTLVRAIDMQTVALGGDSSLDLGSDNEIVLRPRRVVPVALLTQRWPHLLDELRAGLAATSGMFAASCYLFLPEGGNVDVLPEDLRQSDKDFLQLLADGEPRRYRAIVEDAADRARVPRLVDRGLLQMSGLTPSDAAHVLNRQDQWCVEGARLACELFGRASGKVQGSSGIDAQIESLAEAIFAAVVSDSAHMILEQLAGISFSSSDPIVRAITRHNRLVADLKVELSTDLAMIAVGGPAAVFYPAVGERLSKSVIIPEHSAVANAVGAAVGMIKVRVQLEITRGEKSGYLIHGEHEPERLDNGEAALARAEELARAEAERRAGVLGGVDPEIDVQIERIDIPDVEKKFSLIAATVVAEVVSAVGEQAILKN